MITFIQSLKKLTVQLKKAVTSYHYYIGIAMKRLNRNNFDTSINCSYDCRYFTKISKLKLFL